MAVRKEAFDKENQPKKRVRITIDVTPELRRKIRIAAAENDQSVGEYLGNILEQVVPETGTTDEEEEHPLTPDFLEQVYRVREAVIKDSKGEPFEDSTEIIRQMREERTRYLMGEE